MLDKQQLKEITDISVPKIIERMQHEEICGVVATTKESMIPVFFGKWRHKGGQVYRKRRKISGN